MGETQGEEGGSNNTKSPRLPRWTRQEILVLIQGKKLAESRVHTGRTVRAGGTGGTVRKYESTTEPKWSTVSSYCKRHGVNRGPVQCRKRWSNLSADFKKIKDWEYKSNYNCSSESKSESESKSYWVMHNDVRRDRKLPGFFDKEVYEILLTGDVGPLQTDVGPPPPPDDEEEEVVFDSGRSAEVEDGLFSDVELNEKEPPSSSSPFTTTNNINDTNNDDNNNDNTTIPSAFMPAPTPISVGSEKQPLVEPEGVSTSQEGRKRRRVSPPGGDDEGKEEVEAEGSLTTTTEEKLVQVLERNGRILCGQLEAQNINMKLDREERKEHAVGLVAVLNKLADALTKIADKM